MYSVHIVCPSGCASSVDPLKSTQDDTTICNKHEWSIVLFFCIFLTLVPPSLADEVTDLLVTKLSPVVIPCTASGVPLPTIHWTKNGIRLPPRGNGYRILPSGSTFTMILNAFLNFNIPQNMKWNDTFVLKGIIFLVRAWAFDQRHISSQLTFLNFYVLFFYCKWHLKRPVFRGEIMAGVLLWFTIFLMELLLTYLLPQPRHDRNICLAMQLYLAMHSQNIGFPAFFSFPAIPSDTQINPFLGSQCPPRGISLWIGMLQGKERRNLCVFCKVSSQQKRTEGKVSCSLLQHPDQCSH